MPEIDFSNLPSVTNYTFYPLLFDNNPLEILIGGVNSGKCFGKGTEIVMADGRLKKIEDINKAYRDWETDRKSTRLNSSHRSLSRMPSSA